VVSTRFRYIAVEGPPGAGKTALAEELARRLEAARALERVDNPFLRDFYADKPGAAFQTQMFFLLSRYRQLSELAQRHLFQQVTLSDYILAKDKIFAYLTLDDTELMIYEKIYKVLAVDVPLPDLVLYLQAPVEVLARRLRARPRTGEASPRDEYLAEVVKAYDYFFFHYAATPLLVVNTAELDLSRLQEEMEPLLQQIESLTGGTRFYVPARRR
jgi:deoxyadenosine/deoxycytidine kinase